MKKNKAATLQTRQNLLNAALITFDQYGVSHATLSQIAQEAGLTRGALYWHFKNKEDLFDALCETMLNTIIIKTPDSADYIELIWANASKGMLHFFNKIKTDENLKKFFRIIHLKCEHTQTNQSIINVFKKYQMMWEEDLSLLIEDGKKTGKLSPTLDTSFAIFFFRSALIGLSVSWLNAQDFDLMSTANATIDACIHYLEAYPHD